MIASLPRQFMTFTVRAQTQRANLAWVLWFLGVIGITVAIGMALLRQTPSFAPIGWMCFIAGVIALFYQPRYGVYMLVGLTLIGDSVLDPWYPFVKNLSSAESLLYVGRAISFSPAEIYLALTCISWLARILIKRKLAGYRGPLFWPVIVFTLFITFGLMNGLLHHGNSTVALWEVRTIYCLPIMLLLTSNLIETRAQVNLLIWIIIIALFVDGLSGVWYVVTVLKWDLHLTESIAEHSYSIHLNTLFVFTVAIWMFRGSRTKRIILPLMLPTTLLSYFANQRRASYITLAIAMILIAVVLYQVHRKAFWIIIPIAGVVGAIYIAAFWNSTGGIGGPARAIRSVIAPQPGGRDDSSNEYRVLENINTIFTIKSNPITGIGFGQKFYMLVHMPDISFFVWWEYITHNSIMWIWMQAGAGGFIAMLCMIGMAVMTGVRILPRMPTGNLRAITLTATLYVVMHFIFAYVDMSWDTQSMMYMGTMMGLINTLERIVAKPMPVKPARWPWQHAALPAAALRSPQEGYTT